ncbi:hypothetical protein EC917_11277 [Bacillus thuringiensis]|uniref:Apea-like HEPN domain-containing protein n=1 Tax=Bacillus thuringiensis TaxID=1428 RepID=A0A4R4BBQ4_BACTU|nr:hypothetical protein [Bacillus thuringiensis]TCW52958.1 hypothetical protein EC917_11277 [Bacillus thuringiensis]TCW53128.1 hypothetical protein EC910_11277 [Bacillus thuringiensis]
MHYVRIVFFISKEYDFDIENEYIVFESGSAKCKVAIDRRFEDLKVILSYGGFQDRDVAQKEGDKLLYNIKKRFIKEGIPINISGGLGILDTNQQSFENGGFTEYGLKNIDVLFPQLANTTVKNEKLGMEIYDIDEDISEVKFLGQKVNITKKLKFPELKIENYKEDEKLSTAYSLLNSSNAINDLRASFLLKVSSIESLVPDDSYKDEKYKNIINQINKLISTEKLNNDFDIPEKDFNKITQKIKSSIGALKKKSISEKCRELIEQCNLKKTYMGMDVIPFFNECYKIRSEFVHTGTYKNSISEVQKIRELEMYNMELNKLILDVLEFYEHNII